MSAYESGNHDPLSLVERKAIELAHELLGNERTVQVFLFGSRASGRAFPRSDFDIGIDTGHPIAPETLVQIREAFDVLPIFQKVDVIDFAGVDETFKAVARKATRILYERKAA
ncbi:MAG: nucleotidyltransferase domain-containing protein [Nitrospira defluvii]|nr:nucleotidyltransferase domain-containing protein [Nitrospira defluvii]